MVILLIAWVMFGLFLFTQNAPYIQTLKPNDAFIVFILFLFSGPIMVLAAIFQFFINLFLPEGWDNNDDNDNGV